MKFSILWKMKFVSRLFLFFAFVALATLSACNFPWSEDDPVVVSVGSKKLTESQIHAMVPEWNSWDDSMRLSFLTHWIDEETIYQEAIASGMGKDENLVRQIEQTTRKLVVDYFLQTFADTMMLSDAEKLDYYHSHAEDYVRGKNLITGGILYFKEWKDADTYYKSRKGKEYENLPDSNYLVKKIERFELAEESPDSCLIPNLGTVPLRTLSVMKACGGALKMFVVTSRLDSADVLPYEEVQNDVENEVWVIHKAKVMEELKNQWKNNRPIFSQAKVFSKKGGK